MAGAAEERDWDSVTDSGGTSMPLLSGRWRRGVANNGAVPVCVVAEAGVGTSGAGKAKARAAAAA